LSFDGRPLVRFIADKKLRSGRFAVIAEIVAAPIIKQLRLEEAQYLGIEPEPSDSPRINTRSRSHQPISEQSANQILDLLLEGQAPASDLRLALQQVHPDQGEVATSRPQVASLPKLSDSAELHLDDIPEPASGRSKLVDHNSGQVYRLTVTEMTIGRGQDNAISLTDGNASRYHALLQQNAVGKWRLTDLGSTNGTLVNGHLFDQAILRDHDELTIGVTVLEFLAD
jgi:hypothetical protein